MSLLAVVIMVKDEAQSIEATLSPFVQAGIQHFLVLDTGSQDETIAITKRFFTQHQLKGALFQEPFVDFSTSRNQALTLAEETFPDTTFFVMPDAEWYIHHAEKLITFCEHECDKDTPLYLVKISMGSLAFTTARLFRRAAHIRFQGAVHEVPSIPTYVSAPEPIHFEVNASHQGKEKSKKRWERDAVLLLKSYQTTPNDPRTVFYLAQTYECLGENEKAFTFYQQRATLNGWDEENFITFFRLGCLAERISQSHGSTSWSSAMDYFLKAHALRPHRIEPLVKIADHYWPENIPTCYLFIKRAYDMPYPTTDILFVEKIMYDYTRYEIMSRCAWYLGEYALGEQATKRALTIYPTMEHLQRNLTLYKDKIKSLITL